MNDNVFVQFGRYMVKLAQGDFGNSIQYKRPVVDIISERLPMTIELTIGAMIFSSIVGILLGVVSALRRNTAMDVSTMIIANIGVSMPVFWLGFDAGVYFCAALKRHAFYIPPSGRLSSGISLIPSPRSGISQDLTGLGKFLITFISNSTILNGLLTLNFLMIQGCALASDPAFPGGRHHSARDHRPHDPLQPARSARPGLYPHGARQRG